MRVVRIDYSHARGRVDRAVEEKALRGEVVFHGVVIVEVVTGEVGEDGHIERDADHAALIERVAGNFGDQFSRAAGHAFGHQFE